MRIIRAVLVAAVLSITASGCMDIMGPDDAKLLECIAAGMYGGECSDR